MERIITYETVDSPHRIDFNDSSEVVIPIEILVEITDKIKSSEATHVEIYVDAYYEDTNVDEITFTPKVELIESDEKYNLRMERVEKGKERERLEQEQYEKNMLRELKQKYPEV